MIIDKLTNADLYYKINQRISSALEYLKTTNFDNIETGRHDIDGDIVYALVNDYTTKHKEEAKLESHRKYIDVQYVASGCELLGYALFNDQKPLKEYDDEKDFMLFDEEISFINFNKGMFAVIFPEDLHMPGIMRNSPAAVRKIIIKVKI